MSQSKQALATSVPEVSNLADILRWRAHRQPQQRAHTFLEDGLNETASCTYAELDQRAGVLAARLGMVKGERVLLLCPPGLEYITAFFASMYAGAVAVPAYPPDAARAQRTLPRLQAIIADAQVAVVLTTPAIRDLVTPFADQLPGLQGARWHVFSLPELDADDTIATLTHVEATDLAFLMYTSGSTGTPKGVMVSHANALHNAKHFPGFNQRPPKGVVSWLPLYHDLGLFLGVIHPVYQGIHAALMPPAIFVQHPFRWLQAMSTYRATTSGGPNFAYDLCVRKTTPEQRAELDLSCWNMALNGAEPVRSETLERFVDAFAPCGFRREAMYPSYGLSDATATVAGAHTANAPVVHIFDRAALQQQQVQISGADVGVTLVGCGASVPGQEIVIVDTANRQVAQLGHVGEIWVRGPSIAQGYWNKPEETKRVFAATLADGTGPFLCTGDLGFLHKGELFLTGRLKDLIIIRGQNHYPEDLERTVEHSHPLLRPGCGAAFAIETKNEEQLVLVQEVDPTIDQHAATSAIRQAIIDHHGIDVYAVVLIQPGCLPKTSSGKVQRQTCRELFLAGTLPVVGHWQQSARAAARPNEQVIQPTAATIRGWLVNHFAKKLNVLPETIDVHQPFTSFGLDSAEALSLAGDLERWLKRPLSPTLAWDFPTIVALAAYLAGEDTAAAPDSPTWANEPIAIVGMGCRFPQASSLAEFWALLHNGVDAIGEIPANRWDGDRLYHAQAKRPGTMSTRWGGFLDHVDQFDAEFFGIAPREASHLDPQQRLLLEVAWEALEHAGQAPTALAGSRAGVFVGICNSDHARRELGQIDSVGQYGGIGTAYSITANRISYTLDLRGPSMAIDTACSSSLVAVHLACQSLRGGESSMALAGGVNLMLSPEISVAFSKANMMAADGRCKTYDARANGYVRAEGCGILVLKRLSDALANNDNVLAVIRGSAVNQDGRSNGITAPNGVAQQDVIRHALHSSGVTPAQIDYVEAHGTGTPLGDVIETQALLSVFSEPEREKPCLIGSVKTNIGHTEAAAGVAGIIKTVLAMQHDEIPRHLHFQSLNPKIDLGDNTLQIATAPHPWSESTRVRRAGVSSFGFGGTNAHVVLEEAPIVAAKADSPSIYALSLSARSEHSLRALAHAYAEHGAAQPSISLADVCHTANTGRASFDHRVVALSDNTAQMVEQLRGIAAGQTPTHCFTNTLHRRTPSKIAWMFTGQGSQYVGMGRQLYETQPIFRATLEQCARLLQPQLNRWLIDEMYPADPATSQLDETWLTQPALFALEYALAQLWLAWGITPDAVFGHSVGEYVAACVAGVFTLEDACALIAARAQLMDMLPRDGAMVAVMAGEAEVVPLLEAHATDICLAACNGRAQIVLSGRAVVIERLLLALDACEIGYQRLTVSHAFHSPLMEPMLPAFVDVLQRVRFAAPRIPIVSNLTGAFSTPGDEIEYWQRHVCEPVRFMQSVDMLIEQGFGMFLEVGPKASLCGMVRRITGANTGVLALPSLVGQPGIDDWTAIASCAAQLYTHGFPLDWRAFEGGQARHKVALPTYPFERLDCWYAPQTNLQSPQDGLHPLIDQEIVTPGISETVFQKRWSGLDTLLQDHRVHGRAMLPGVGFIEMAVAAAGASVPLRLNNIVMTTPLVPQADGDTLAQVIISKSDGDSSFKIVSTALPERAWVTHATGTYNGRPEQLVKRADFEELRTACSRHLAADMLYQAFQRSGIDYGPFFRSIVQVWLGTDSALAELRLPEAAAAKSGFTLHPALLDAALQTVGALFVPEGESSLVPFAIDEIIAYQPLPSHVFVHAERRESSIDMPCGDLQIFDSSGQVLVVVRGLHLRQVNQPVQAAQTKLPLADWFHELRWQPVQLDTPKPQPQRKWLIFADIHGVGAALRDQLSARGDTCVVVLPGDNFAAHDQCFTLDPRNPEEYTLLLNILQAQGIVPNGVLHLWSCAEPCASSLATIDDELYHGVYSLLFLARALAEQQVLVMQYGIISSYGPAIDRAPQRPIVPARAAMWGVGKGIAVEHGSWLCLGIDFETRGVAPTYLAAQVLAEIDASVAAPGGTWVAYADGKRLAATLEPHPQVAEKRQPLPLRAGGVYLVTGGQSGIGFEIAKFIAANVPARLLLVNRTMPDPQQQPDRIAGIRALESLGAEVVPVAADVTDAAALAHIVLQAHERWGRIDGVVHSAGVLQDGMLWTMDQARFDNALRPKVHGTLALTEATAQCELDFFVICSSMAALRPAPGQSNHVAANSFEDAFAHAASRTSGRRFLAVNWGLWGETGVVASERYLKPLAAKGIHAFSNAQGIEGLRAALQSEVTQVAFFNPGSAVSGDEFNNQPVQVIEQVRSKLPELQTQFSLAHYETLAAPLHKVSLAYILRALAQLGWQPVPGEHVDPHELATQLAIAPHHQHLFAHLLHHLRDSGVLQHAHECDAVLRVLDWGDPEQTARELQARYPDFSAELALLTRCGTNLASVLRGADPLPLLFPGGSLANSDSIYQHSVFSRFYQTIAQHTAAVLCAQLPPDQPLRVLEVGAGTGGTTAYVLPTFPAERTHYVFTDVSQLFLQKAQEKFQAFPFVEYRRLNIEHDPQSQGYKPDSFDLVVAANVLHATGDISRTLQHIAQLLAPGGSLLLLELMRPQAWLDLTFGLTNGWWRCATEGDPMRQDYPLVGLEEWQNILCANGFACAEGVPSMKETVNHVAAQAVVLAQRANVPVSLAAHQAAPVTVHSPPAPTTMSALSVPGELFEVVQNILTTQVVTSLQLTSSHIPLDQSFHALGLDSLLAVEIIGALKEKLRVTLSPTLLFEYSSIESFSAYLLREHGAKLGHLVPTATVAPRPHAAFMPRLASAQLPSTTPMQLLPATPAQPVPLPAPVAQVVAKPATQPMQHADLPSDAVAIVGMACRFPGATDLDAFWRLLSEGRNTVTEVPPDRWNWHDHFDQVPGTEGKTYSRWGGYLDGIEQFDARFFNISPKEAQQMDPQQRLFLEVSWQALEHAGYAGSALADSDTGVFVGCSYNHYFQLQQRQALHEARDYLAALGNSNAILANRASFFFNFHGPSVVVDTLCSSSLVALHMACQSLRSGECTTALVGGVNILLTPDHHISMSQIKAYAPDGQCKTFDQRANGFVSGEGVGAVLLKPLSQALADNDTVYAVIRGSAVSHNGRTNGMTAPTPRGQAATIRKAHQAAGVTPASISYVEAHGTGTALGDPIEIEGLCQAFGTTDERENLCLIGSVKTNLGHLEAAAGIASLIKVALSLQHYQIPASLYFDEPNEHIDFEASPFRVNTVLHPWKTQGPRRAGVSSFGMGGVNAHLVLEEAPFQPAARTTPHAVVLLPLSARSEPALVALAQHYHDFLAAHPGTRLADFCYTASTGRAHFKHRTVLAAASVTELRRELRRLIEAGPPGAVLVAPPQSAQLNIAQEYLTGGNPNWAKLYAHQPRRIAIPNYPFERERFWFGEAAQVLHVSLPRDRERARANPLRGRRQQ